MSNTLASIRICRSAQHFEKMSRFKPHLMCQNQTKDIGLSEKRIHSHDHFTSDPVLLGLIRAKCMPILLYGIESYPLLIRQVNSLEFSLTTIFMRIFCTNSPVKQCQVNLGILPIACQLIIRTARFLQKCIGHKKYAVFIICALCEIITY
jgi:hypothetical protein